MTVSSTTTKVSYTGNGSTSAFAYTFKIFAESDIKVWVNGIQQTLTTHYTVSGTGASSGGNITFESGSIPANLHPIVFVRNIARTQVTDYVENDTFPAETHEAALDKLTLIAQEMDNKMSADLFRFAETVTDAGTIEISLNAATRSSKILSFDSTGGLVATQEIGVYTGNWAASTAYVVRSLIKDTSNNNIYICITAHTSSGSQPISSNTDVAKWALIVDSASASTSASAASTSATASATSATASATSATASATSATASASSASAAGTSAGTASTQATAASNSAAASAASYDAFDDRFLGAKTSDPTVDNDGDTLIDGALFFRTDQAVMKVYKLSTTTWINTTPSPTNQGHITTVAGISSDVTAVAGKAAEVARLGTSAAVADMVILATSDVVTDMNTLATSAIVADMDVLGASANVAAMGLLGTSAVVADLAILATSDVVSDMNVLGSAAVVEDLNILGTADVVSDMNTLATSGNVTAMSTVATNVAGVNAFASRYRVSSSEPSADLDAGDLYFNTSTNELRAYGTAWQATAPSSAVQASINIVAGDVVYSEDLGSIADALTTSSGNGDITEVAGAIANVNALANSAVLEDMAFLGTAAVVEDMGILGTSANVTAMSTVSTSIASVNSFANQYTIASSSPGSPSEGDLWYDSSNNVIKYHNGSTFITLAPGIADLVSDGSPQLGGALDGQNNNLTNIGTVSGANLQIDFGSIV